MKKKILALLTSVALVATMLVGCGAKEEAAPAPEPVVEEAVEEATEDETVEDTTEEVAEEAATELGADTQAIVDRGVLKVGVHGLNDKQVVVKADYRVDKGDEHNEVCEERTLLGCRHEHEEL